jgi:3-hydroxyisobutyrate dehydrogenase-like beta-hydroxyacid dehydrogenase
LASHQQQAKEAAMPPSQNQHIGVVGLGHMGDAFAENLLADGFPITAFDKSADRVRILADKGARAAENLGDLSACDFVLTSLPDDAALRSVTLDPDGLTSVMQPDAVHISASTISAALSRELAQAHRARGQRYVAAPVLGNPDLAHQRGLYVLAGGLPADIARARPILERLGQKLFVVGDDPALANIMKLAGNVLTAATLQSMGEVLALLRKAGIDAQTGYDVLTGSLFDGKVHKTYGGKIVREAFSPAGLTVPLAAKDLRLALREAELAQVSMPVASIVRDRLVALEARGWSDLDWSALGKLAAADAGLPP